MPRKQKPKMGRPPIPRKDKRVHIGATVKPETAMAIKAARRTGEGLGHVLDRWAEGAP
jgi:hypothetical protein